MFHITTAPHPRSVAWLASLAVALAACESTGPGTRALSLSVTTKSATSASMARATADPSGGSISLPAAQPPDRAVELAPAGPTGGAERAHVPGAGSTPSGPGRDG